MEEILVVFWLVCLQVAQHQVNCLHFTGSRTPKGVTPAWIGHGHCRQLRGVSLSLIPLTPGGSTVPSRCLFFKGVYLTLKPQNNLFFYSAAAH